MGGSYDTPEVTEVGDDASETSAGVSSAALSLPTTEAFEERYVRTELIGRGGMGEIHLASDRWMGREVAIKSVRRHVSERSRDRFVKEARIQGQLQHPSVPPVHDLGLDPDGRPYFTMKALHGTTLLALLDRLRAGNPDARKSYGRGRLLSVFVDVCQAVAFAHERGVLHRDLKPSNVMVGDYGEVYVLDWGVAKVAAEVGDDGESATALSIDAGDTPATQVGAVIGTPGYMSPEQVRAEPTDARSDVYSLGVLLFELLFFEPLHEGTSALVRAASVTAGVDWESRLEVMDISAPPELVAICERATALPPDDRYSSVRQLLADVERYLDGTRDLALRHDMVQRYVERARALTAAGERSEALRELGRAIALEPTDGDATRLLETLFVDLPKELPDQVAEQFERAEFAASQRQARVTALSGLAWLAIPIYFVWMGVRQWEFVIALAIVPPLAAVVAYRFSRSERPTTAPVVITALLIGVMIALTSRLFGPLFITTAMAAVYAMGFVLNPTARRPVAYVAWFTLTFLGPWALERLGFLSPSYRFVGDELVISANIASFTPLPTEALLLTNGIVMVVASCATVLTLRRSLAASRRKVLLQAWQLRQLVPIQS